MATALQHPNTGGDPGFVTEDQRRLAAQHRAVHERHLQALNLQRENILSQKTSHPIRRAALEDALAQIDAQIAKQTGTMS